MVRNGQNSLRTYKNRTREGRQYRPTSSATSGPSAQAQRDRQQELHRLSQARPFSVLVSSTEPSHVLILQHETLADPSLRSSIILVIIFRPLNAHTSLSHLPTNLHRLHPARCSLSHIPQPTSVSFR
jgi:hypothetical protein